MEPRTAKITERQIKAITQKFGSPSDPFHNMTKQALTETVPKAAHVSKADPLFKKVRKILLEFGIENLPLVVNDFFKGIGAEVSNDDLDLFETASAVAAIMIVVCVQCDVDPDEYLLALVSLYASDKESDSEGEPLPDPIGSSVLKPAHVPKVDRNKFVSSVKELRTTMKRLVWRSYQPKEYRDRQSGLCFACHAPISYHSHHLAHVIPRIANGPYNLQNLRPICGDCNDGCGDMPLDLFISLIKAGTVDPRGVVIDLAHPSLSVHASTWMRLASDALSRATITQSLKQRYALDMSHTKPTKQLPLLVLKRDVEEVSNLTDMVGLILAGDNTKALQLASDRMELLRVRALEGAKRGKRFSLKVRASSYPAHWPRGGGYDSEKEEEEPV